MLRNTRSSFRRSVVDSSALNASSRRRRVGGVLLSSGLALGWLLVGAGIASAVTDDDKKDMNQAGDMLPTSSEAGEGSSLMTQRVSLERDSASILQAFSPVVAVCPDSTVEITVAGDRVALGTIVSSDGEVLTKASQLTGTPRVQWGDTQWDDVDVLGIDLQEDLALLKVPGQGLEAISFDETSQPQVGAWVVSTLSMKQPQSLAIGIVSVKSRRIPKEQGALGIRMDQYAQGVVVSGFSGEDTPAEKSGLRVGDRIIEIDSEPVDGINDLKASVQAHSPGEILVLTIERGDATVSLDVELGTLGIINEAMRHREMQDSLGSDLSRYRSGFSVALQHDSPLDAKDCGGPLFDLDGKLVGLNIARAGRVNSYALPAELVQSRLEKLRAGELKPETVFADRIGRLEQAVESMRAQMDEDTSDDLAKIDQELKVLLAVENVAEKSLEKAKADLAQTQAKIEELQARKNNLENQIETLQERQEKYQTMLEALKQGIRLR